MLTSRPKDGPSIQLTLGLTCIGEPVRLAVMGQRKSVGDDREDIPYLTSSAIKTAICMVDSK